MIKSFQLEEKNNKQPFAYWQISLFLYLRTSNKFSQKCDLDQV